MTYKELYHKVQLGEITLPVTVKIVERLWDEFELDEGCKAKLKAIQTTGEVDELKVHLDYSEFIEYNKTFWKYNYYDSNRNPTLAIWQTKWFTTDNGKCDCYVEDENDLQFEIVKDKRIIEFQSSLQFDNIGRLELSSTLPNTSKEDAYKQVKVTIEFLEE